jgi:hypothetical protein
VYKTHQAAMHARQKLHGFEYPMGESKLLARSSYSFRVTFRFVLGLIVKLSSELTNFTADPTFFSSNKNDTNFCSVPLPPPLPIAPSNSPVAQRLFIVCTPHVLPLHVLKKVFCRFGYLIDVYILNNRNCGYVKYAKTESAKQVSVS